MHVICMTAIMFQRRLGINHYMVANPARGQLNRKIEFSLSPFAPANLVSRESFDCPVPLQPSRSLHQGQIRCLLTSSSHSCRFSQWHPTILSTAIGSVEQGKWIFSCPRLRLRVWSRETGSAVPSRISLLISILRLNLVLTYGIPPEFRSGVHSFI